MTARIRNLIARARAQRGPSELEPAVCAPDEQPKERGRMLRLPSLPRRSTREPEHSTPGPADVPLMRAINLLPPRAHETTRWSRSRQAALVLAAGTLAASAPLVLLYTQARSDVAAKRGELAAVQAEATVRPREQTKGTEEGKRLADERTARTSALATALASRVSWDRFLRDLSLVLPNRVWLSQLSTTPEATGESGAEESEATPLAVTINGYTESQWRVARLLTRLEVLPELSSVRLLSSKSARAMDQPVIEFSVVVVVKGERGART
ncbi:MAG: PilN domain-containing protein [Actinomycetota bacterium]|nr:PilN domain-containing protein [Actinomycetota bacterium]